MKRQFALLIIPVLFLIIGDLKCQSFNNGLSLLPLKSSNSVLFGKDIVINDNPSRDQRLVKVCSSFNGWLFALYTYRHSVQDFPGFTILRSTDNGITWAILIDGYDPAGNGYFSSSDMVVTGASVPNLKLFMVLINSGNESTGFGQAEWYRYNAETGIFEGGGLLNGGYSISVCSDFTYPASNSNPYSVGIVYTQYLSIVGADTVIFLSSSNGGLSFDNRKVLAGSSNWFDNVTLTYGRSLSESSGRYYAAWEEKANFTSTTGHIYTAHSEPNFNSSWTTPVMLDGLNSSINNKVRNPSIACQYNNIDNDSSSFTEVVLFDTYNSATSSYDINGFYNMKPTNTDHFTLFTPNLADGENRQEASINFNPFDSTFMLTYYDATNQKLPFLTHNFNMINENSWNVLNSGYNDSSNLANPNPRVALNFAEHKGMNVWVAEGQGGNGVAMFDAPYSTYTFTTNSQMKFKSPFLSVYPNPCRGLLNLYFELKNEGRVMVFINDLAARKMGTITDQSYAAGRHLLKYDISGYAPGSYAITAHTGQLAETCRLIVIK
jgi:hypothetical protein